MITMVVPIYNMERYLSRCVDSLLSQTCRDFEIILVDDGSTDFSGALCDSYAARYPELVRVVHKKNGGQSSARNIGIDNARGEWVVFPDPDDWVEQDYVESFLHFQRQFGAELVCMGFYVDTDDVSEAKGPDTGPYLITGCNECQRSILIGPSLQGFSWNKIYRMDIIRENELRFPDGMDTLEDVYFTYRYLAHCSQIVHVPGKRVYHYYQRDNSTTRSGYSSRKLGSIRIYENIIADCRKRDPELARAAADIICTEAVNLIWMLVNSRQNAPEDMKYLRDQIRRTLPRYLHSGQYGVGRKLQAVLALLSPRLYALLKNAVHRKKRLPARKGC